MFTNSVARGVRPRKMLIGFPLLVLALAACATGATTQPAVQTSTSVPAVAEAASTAVPPLPTAPAAVNTPEPQVTATTAVPTPTAQADTSGLLPPPTFSGESPEALAERLSQESIEYLIDFVDGFSPRESGSDDELAAAEFLMDEFEALGYDAALQTFDIEFIARGNPVFSLVSPEERTLRSLPMSMSGTGDATAALVHVGQAFAEDIPEEGLQGKIALIERGVITFEEKVTRVAEAGALGAVVYNNVSGGFGGTLMNEGEIPAVSITREDGEEILGLMQLGEVLGNVNVQIDSRDSQNVIAEKAGTSDDGKVVILGAHYDTVPETEGASDNSTGVTTLVQLAEELSDREFPFTLRFIFFGVEEIGLFGSRHYIDSIDEAERDNIIAMLNFDAIGAGEAAIMGDTELTSRVTDYADANDFALRLSPGLQGGSSDHAPFQAVGIPAIFFFGDDFSVINSPADTLDLIQPDLMGTQGVLGLALLDMLAAIDE